MRDSKVCSMNLRSHGHKECNGFLIREVPVRPLTEGQYVMDYDVPELLVFLYEDHQQFVKDVCIDRGDSTKGKCLLEDCGLDHNTPFLFDTNMNSNSNSNVGTTGTASSNSSGSESSPGHLCIKGVTKTYDFRNLMMEGEVELGSGDKNSIDHPTKKRTSEALGEIFRKDDYSRSFSFKHWQINSFLGTSGSRVEFPHCAEYQPFPKATSVSRPQIGISQSLTGSGKSFDRQTDYPEETSCAVGPLCGPTSDTVLATKSDRASDQSNDSTSSTNSFSFPILSPEWNGSPVKMVEADRGQSRKHQWRKICFPCCKF